jgi:ATP-dependent helicase/nuclease subunit A
VPSLTGFLSWLEAEDTEIRRQLESAGGRIRVMTVHGSKGLEAPLVILPDTVRRKEQKLRSEVVIGDDGKGWWVTPKNASPAIVDRAREQALAAEEKERERLLYVAMTRAQTWLIVCGAGDPANAEWHRRIEEGVEALGPAPIETPTGPGLRYQHGDWETCAATDASPVKPHPPPHLAHHPRARSRPKRHAPSPPPTSAAPRPSPARPPSTRTTSLRRGRQTHRLLEHLPAYPEADWPRLAPALLAHGDDPASPEDAAALLAEVARILTEPGARPALRAGHARRGPRHRRHSSSGRPLAGTIDRLIVTPDRILVVDFKTNAVVPAHRKTSPKASSARWAPTPLRSA